MTPNLWTFIIEYEGGTYISQFENMELVEAIQKYNIIDPSGQGAVPLEEGYTPLNGAQSVFCLSGTTNKSQKLFSKREKAIFGNAILTAIK